MLGNITMGNNNITTTADPTGDKDLSRKKYVDDQDAKKLSKAGGTMSGNIIMRNNKITTTADPTGDKDLCRKKYIDVEVDKKINKTCGHFTGDIYMATNTYIHNAGTPTSGNILCNKTYVDNAVRNNVKLQGSTTGDITIGQYQISTSRDPAFNNNLCRKLYADTRDNL